MFKRSYSVDGRTNSKSERGIVLMDSRIATHSKKNGADRYVTTRYRFHRDDAAEYNLSKGDTIDLLFDPQARIGCLQRSRKGRKLMGDTTLYVSSVWKPEDPCLVEDLQLHMNIIRGGGSYRGTPLPDGLCFDFPEGVFFSMNCPIKIEDNVSSFNSRYNRK